jgi:hypothetical protein
LESVGRQSQNREVVVVNLVRILSRLLGLVSDCGQEIGLDDGMIFSEGSSTLALPGIVVLLTRRVLKWYSLWNKTQILNSELTLKIWETNFHYGCSQN